MDFSTNFEIFLKQAGEQLRPSSRTICSRGHTVDLIELFNYNVIGVCQNLHVCASIFAILWTLVNF